MISRVRCGENFAVERASIVKNYISMAFKMAENGAVAKSDLFCKIAVKRRFGSKMALYRFVRPSKLGRGLTRRESLRTDDCLCKSKNI